MNLIKIIASYLKNTKIRYKYGSIHIEKQLVIECPIGTGLGSTLVEAGDGFNAMKKSFPPFTHTLTIW